MLKVTVVLFPLNTANRQEKLHQRVVKSYNFTLTLLVCPCPRFCLFRIFGGSSALENSPKIPWECGGYFFGLVLTFITLFFHGVQFVKWVGPTFLHRAGSMPWTWNITWDPGTQHTSGSRLHMCTMLHYKVPCSNPWRAEHTHLMW